MDIYFAESNKNHDTGTWFIIKNPFEEPNIEFYNEYYDYFKKLNINDGITIEDVIKRSPMAEAIDALTSDSKESIYDSIARREKEFLKNTFKTTTSVQSQIIDNYGAFLSNFLNNDIDKIFHLFWAKMIMTTYDNNDQTKDYEKEPYPLPQELIYVWVEKTINKIEIDKYIKFADNVILFDGMSLNNVQKCVLFEKIFGQSSLYSFSSTSLPHFKEKENNYSDKIFLEKIIGKDLDEIKKMNIAKKQICDFPYDNISLIKFTGIEGFLRYLIYKVLVLNIQLKKCANCGKYFYPENRSDTIYCDNKSPQDGNLTCKEYGSQKLWYDKLKNNECMKLCRNIYQAKQMLVKRNPDIEGYKASFERFKIQSQEWKSDVKNGIKTEVDFIEWLEQVKKVKS